LPSVHHLGPVCIDGRMLNAETGTGVSTYARTLLDTLKLLDCDPHLLVDTVGTRDRWAARRAALSPWRTVSAFTGAQGAPTELRNRQLFAAAHMHFSLTGRLMPVHTSLPAGIMHWTYPVPLRLQGWRNIYTVHDVIPLDHPALSGVSPVRLRAVLTQIRRTADRIVTVSQASRAAIIATMGWPADFVADCGQAVMPVEDIPLPLPAGLKPQGYFVCVGLIEPRKNIARLLDAYIASGIDTPLVFAGPDETGAAALTARIDATPHAIRVRYLPPDAFHSLIRRAKALLFPSLAEGFGLPVAEAMTVSVPVMTSNRGALAETAGDAAMLVDPESVERMAECLIRLDRDVALRESLAEAGAIRAESFTQRAFALRLEEVYATHPATASRTVRVS
jgi:glycosyltransferase involved in cell wall biosynthesis